MFSAASVSESSNGAIQRPPDHASRVGVEHNSQEHELVAQPNVRNIGPPELIRRSKNHIPRQVRTGRRLGELAA